MSQDFQAESAAPAEPSRYPVLKGLGLGAKSETYLCQDSLTGRQLARKFLNPEVSAELPDIVDVYFSRWAALDHPNVVKVLDFGWEEGRAYLCTEFAEGVPIVQALTGAPLDKVWRVFGQLLLALDYLDANNVPHLDLKPKNVLVGADASGQPWLRLVDYGLMPLLYPFSYTDSNAIGTPPYTAPEYALRRNPDLRSDLYSVGILLFTILARRPPYEGKDPVSLVQMQLQRDAPALKSVVAGAPPPISDFLQRLLSRDPNDRFASAQQALFALQAAVGPNFPPLAWPPPFSDSKQVFTEAEFLKIFRRIALQGGLWAIRAPKGGGKSFFARWLEGILWLNQKRVMRLSGETLGLVQGEIALNPAYPTYLIIDDADRAPTEAWLRARPYGHVIALGEALPWATKAKGWELKELKPLNAAQLRPALEKNFGKLDPRVMEFVQTIWRASPGRLALAGEALRLQGMVQREGSAWKWDAAKFLGQATGPSVSALGHPLAALPEGQRAALGALVLAAAPWQRRDLPESGDWDTWSQLGWTRRILKGGVEYFRANFSVEGLAETGLDSGQAEAVLLAVGRRGWPDAALLGFDRLLARGRALPPEGALLRAELLSKAQRHAEVLGLVNAALVQALPAEKKGLAYEIFGEALLATGKDKQAEAGFKTAFPSYKSAGDTSGQSRVLSGMGRLMSRAGDTGKALQFFQQALGAAAGSPDADLLRGQIEMEIARLYVTATDFESAETHFQAGLAALETAGRGDALGKAYAAYAEHCLQMNDPDRAEIFCHEALGWALFHQDPLTQAKVFSTWAILLKQREDHRAAVGRYSEAVDVLANGPHEMAYARALLARADFFDVARELDAAQKDSRAAFEVARRLKSQELEGETLLQVGKIQSRDLGKLDAALKTLQTARPLLEASGNARRIWECYFQMGECERFRAQRDAARAWYQRAAQVLDQVLAGIVPQTFDHEQLSKKRREIDFALGAMG